MYCKDLRDVEFRQGLEWMNAHVEKRIGVPGAKFPADMLPKTGVVVMDEGTVRCIGFLYLEESSAVAVMGFLVANPDNTVRESYNAIRMLIHSAPKFGYFYGKKYMMSYFGHSILNSMLFEDGWIKMETGVTNMFKRINVGE